MRTFRLERDVDVTGISGIGIVADGVVFPDGVTVIRWRGERQSTVIWPCIGDVEAIHGHGGATRIVWATQRVTVSKAAKNKAIRSALSTKTVRVIPMTGAQRLATHVGELPA